MKIVSNYLQTVDGEKGTKDCKYEIKFRMLKNDACIVEIKKYIRSNFVKELNSH